MQLVERRIGGGAKIDIAIDDDGRGMDDADVLFGIFGRVAPFLDKLAGIGFIDGRFVGVVPGSQQVMVVHGPVLGGEEAGEQRDQQVCNGTRCH